MLQINNGQFDSTWNITDDQVMGGKSQSYINLVSDYAVFNGTISSDGGGFCTTQSRDLYPIDVSQYDGLALTVSSEKNFIYKMALGDATDKFFYVTWEAAFEVQAGQTWQTIYIPFDSFSPSWYGYYQWSWLFPLDTA